MRILLAGALGVFLPLPASAGGCLAYDDPVTLEGILASGTFAGPPNYESVEAGDRPETVLLLRLKDPVCVDAAADGMSDAVQGADAIQLALRDARQLADLKRLVGRPVRLSGSLFGAMSGHHHTPVLLEKVVLTPSP